MMDTITVSCEEYKALVEKAAMLDAIIRLAKADKYGRVETEVACVIAGVPYKKEGQANEKA